ncbi:MAG TPA: tRNA-dihydrouridine synthase family protein [Gammaproteobacteria bacterium]|nr:tRNA-dihydrouridine synthase family protein [Gammaproteobacteria bacterium]
MNIIQGPLAGISCAPFRRLTWRYGRPAFSCTEMISCKTLIHQSSTFQQRFIKIDPQEGPVCFQLSSSEPTELAEATKRVTDYGADLIDLNCGCPVNKIRSKGAGSKLLTEANKLYALICAMKNNTHLPVSIKIRVEGHSNDKFNVEVAKVVTEAGADFLIVHGRHWTEHYETPCNYAEIKFFVDAMKIPVIGNGDITCLTSLKKMLATGCAGVMLARAGVGQPWLIQKLIAEMQQQDFLAPSTVEIGLMFIEHIEQLAMLLGNEKMAILQARKFAKYYARRLPNKADFCAAINVCNQLAQLRAIVIRYFVGNYLFC